MSIYDPSSKHGDSAVAEAFDDRRQSSIFDWVATAVAVLAGALV